MPGFELGELGLGGACALLAAMEVLLLLGVGGGGGVGGGVIACGSVESYGIYTCGLFRRVGWNVSICIGFCASRSEQHGIYSVFACFQKAVFSGRSNPMVLTLLSTPVDCSCASCLLMFLRIKKSRKT